MRRGHLYSANQGTFLLCIDTATADFHSNPDPLERQWDIGWASELCLWDILRRFKLYEKQDIAKIEDAALHEGPSTFRPRRSQGRILSGNHNPATRKAMTR